MYLKRQKVPKNWPILRKGTKYVVRPGSNLEEGIPVLIALRNMLRIAQTRKEVKRAIHLNYILVNNKIVKDERRALLLDDTISLIPQKKHYRLEISKNKKFDLVEIKENEANYKTSKIVNKKILKGKKVQLNLLDGRNFISDIKCKTGDSVLINFKDKKIERCLPLQEKSKAMVFAGKHAGKKGTIKKIDKEHQIIEMDTKEESINVLTKQLIVIG